MLARIEIGGGDDMPTIEGGCLCGEVRYRADAEPVMQVICHCRSCQKNTGSGFSMNIAVPAESLRVTGDSHKMYVDRSGASGKPFERHFCGACGSPIFGSGDAYGALSFIKAGTLDDASWVAPSLHIWCAEKLPCIDIPASAGRAAGNPS
jgi:hypothetical protein